MSWILRVDNLSKIYRLGAGASQHGTIYEQVSKKIKKALAGKKAKSSIDEEAEQQSSTKAVISDEQK